MTASPYIGCKDFGLTSVAGAHVDNYEAETLDLSGNKLTTLDDPRPFMGLPAIESLRLDNNQLSELDKGLFSSGNLTLVQTLRLDNNQLTELKRGLFDRLPSLEELWLVNNQLRELNAGLFDGLGPSLIILWLFSNHLSELETGLFDGLTALETLQLDDNKLSVLDEGLFSALTALGSLQLSNNRLTGLPTNIFSGLFALTGLSLSHNYLIELDPRTFVDLGNLKVLDLSSNRLAAIATVTFAPLAGNISSLYLAGNDISEVGTVLEEMQQNSLETIVMDGNPSRCSIPTKTNQHLNSSIVCACAAGYGRVGDDLCQSPTRAVIIPQAVATLRSHVMLTGPEEQLAPPPNSPQQLDIGDGFFWNFVMVDKNAISVTLHWLSPSEAIFDWTCSPGSPCANGSRGDIVHPPASTPDGFRGVEWDTTVVIKYNVNATTAADTTLVSSERTASIILAYSAFHLPARFVDAFQHDAERNVAASASAGMGLPTPRTLRIQQNVTMGAASTGTMHEPLPTTANVPVQANPRIPTAIIFELVDNTCNIRHAAKVVNVRRIASSAAPADQGGADSCAAARGSTAYDGWEVVVGDPSEMAKATNLSGGVSMPPCTAVLQARDTVTTEILRITTINASIQDCWDNGNPLNLADTRHLSCNGHGDCSPDGNLYDGVFEGCNCDTGREGNRCEVPVLCNRADGEVYSSTTGGCKVFKLSVSTAWRPTLYTVTATEDFHTQPLLINRTATTVSSGYVDNITFTLDSSAPRGFFISSKTGEVFGNFDAASTSNDAQINVTLLAVDASNLQLPVETMHFVVKPKPPSVVWAAVGCAALALCIAAIVHKLRQRCIAEQDALAALARARRAYGLEPNHGNSRGVSVNSGDLVGMTTSIDAAALGTGDAGSDSDVVLLLEHAPADPAAASPLAAAAGYGNAPPVYENDESTDGDYDDDDDDNNNGHNCGAPNAFTMKRRKRRKVLSKFVAPTICLGKSTLAAKGLDVLLGVDPKTYMHVKNKVKVMLKEFAASGTKEDNRNINTMLQGTYVNPGESSGQVRTIEELMQCSEVQDAGLEIHHVLALQVYTSSSFKSINDPMRQSPPVLPHPFAATLYYISDALSMLRELQGKDAATRNETLVFWRGMKNLRITDEFLQTGGSEMACMSTTSSRAVAEGFALSESPLLFKFVSNSFMSHGADISFLSVYPGEKEVLYPPLTYLRPIKITVETIGGIVYRVVEVEPIFPK